MEKMFERASKMVLRFKTEAGLITTEDLWTLPLQSRTKVNLDDIAKSLRKELKDSEDESFVVKRSSANSIIDLKFEIVKHVINDKLAEIEAKENAEAAKTKRDKIDLIIERKKDAALEDMSIEDLEKLK